MFTVTSPYYNPDTEVEHDHVVFYYKRPDGMYEGVTSMDEDHRHIVVARQDPETGEVILMTDPEEDGTDHSHEITLEYPYNEPVQTKYGKDTHTQRVQDLLRMFFTLKDEEKENHLRFEESEKFYAGEQWTPQELKDMAAKKRAALTINKTETYTDDLHGYLSEDDTDAMYSPKVHGDRAVADILNIVKKHVENRNAIKTLRSMWALDLIIGGKTNPRLVMDYDRDVNGEMRIERFPWRRVLYGEHTDKTGRDIRSAFTHEWISFDRAASKYPSIEKELRTTYNLLNSNLDSLAAAVTTEESDDYDRKSVSRLPYIPTERKDEIYNSIKKEILVVEAYRTVYKNAPVIIDMEDGQRYNGYGWRPKDLARLKDKNFVFAKVVPRQQPMIRKTVVVGGIIVDDLDPVDMPGNMISIFPAYAKFVNGKYWGKVHSAKDPQLELNKRRSQSVDAANSMGRGWLTDLSTFGGDEDLEANFENAVGQPNFVAKVADLSNPPIQIQEAPVPAGIVQQVQEADNNLREIMNVKVDPTGSHQSFTHFLEMKKTMLVGNNFLFEAMENLLKRLAELMLYWIPAYYSLEQIAKIVKSTSDQEQEIDGKPLVNYSYEEILNLLQNKDLRAYDVDIVSARYSETMRIANMAMFTEARQSGIDIPFETLVEYSSLPKPAIERIMRQYQSQLQRSQQQMQTTKEMEENKALIAQGIIPADTQARLDQKELEVQQSQIQQGATPGGVPL